MRQNTLDNISLIFFKIDGIFVGIPKKIPTKRRNMIGHVANFMTKISLFRQYYTNRSLLFLQKAAIGGFWGDVIGSLVAPVSAPKTNRSNLGCIFLQKGSLIAFIL